MIRSNATKRKLAAGTPVSIVSVTYNSPALVEQLGYLGFDAVFIDTEHGAASWEEVENMVRAAELSNYTPIVRVQFNDASTITRALDRGAAGVQVPHVNTRAEAETAVKHAKFAPLGHRGFAGGRASLGESMNTFTAKANEETMVVVMLEEVEALDNLDEIVQVENVDAFFIAPGDLSQSMGYPGQMEHPAVRERIDDAIKRIRAAGKAPGTLTTPATLEHYLKIGALFIYVGVPVLLTPASRSFLAPLQSS